MVQNDPKFVQNGPLWSKFIKKFLLKMTVVGATAVGVTAVRNTLKF